MIAPLGRRPEIRRRRHTVLLAALGAALLLPSAAHGAREQVVVSGTVDVPPGRTVGTVVVADGPINIAGRVDGDVVALHGRVRVSGVVDGTVTSVSRRVTVTPGARVTGDVLYGGPKPSVAPGTVEGKVSDEGWTDVSGPGLGILVHLLIWLAVSLSALVLGIVVWWLAPGVMASASRALRERAGAAIGVGLGLFVGLPVVVVLAVATVFGIPLAIAVALALVPLGALGYVTSAWIVGDRILRGDHNWLVTGLAGLGVLRLLALMPVLGALVGVAATILGLGALAVVVWRARGAAPAVAAPAAAPGPPKPVG